MTKTIGPRLWKTGLAVALTLSLMRLVGLPYEVFGALAAVLAIAPTAANSLKTSLELIGANLLGGLVGTLAILVFGPNPIVIGLVVIGVLLLCQVMPWKHLSGTAVTVTLFVMAPHPEAVYAYAGMRLTSVLVGTIVGTLVNAFVLRPDYGPAAAGATRRAGAELDHLIAAVSERLIQPEAFAKQEMLAGSARVEEELKAARQYAGLLAAQGRLGKGVPDQAVVERSIRVLSSLLERIQIVHKAALTARRASNYQEALPEIQAALAELVQYRQQLYELLLARQGVDAALASCLLAMERSFEGAIHLPEQAEEAEVYFRLYRMRSSVSYMANRLGRLAVAMNGALPAEVAGVAETSAV